MYCLEWEKTITETEYMQFITWFWQVSSDLPKISSLGYKLLQQRSPTDILQLWSVTHTCKHLYLKYLGFWAAGWQFSGRVYCDILKVETSLYVSASSLSYTEFTPQDPTDKTRFPNSFKRIVNYALGLHFASLSRSRYSQLIGHVLQKWN